MFETAEDFSECLAGIFARDQATELRDLRIATSLWPALLDTPRIFNALSLKIELSISMSSSGSGPSDISAFNGRCVRKEAGSRPIPATRRHIFSIGTQESPTRSPRSSEKCSNTASLSGAARHGALENSPSGGDSDQYRIYSPKKTAFDPLWPMNFRLVIPAGRRPSSLRRSCP